MEYLEMSVKEFLEMDIDVDISDDIEERVDIAFCGPCELTDFGKERFADILDCKIRYYEDSCYAVICLDECEDWEEKLDSAELLFVGFAGYIADSLFKRLFKD